MSDDIEHILLVAPYGKAFYIGNELQATWDHRDADDYVNGQVTARVGEGVEVVERKWHKPSFPKTLPAPAKVTPKPEKTSGA